MKATQNTPSRPVTETLFLGGTEQVIQVLTHDETHPVLLFLHGGPGITESGGLWKIASHLLPSFTLVHWDQRGSGKSYHEGVPSSTLSTEQMLLDLDELIRYLQQRFQKEQILLVGHSWGTCLGLKYAQQHGEKLSAYVGVSQVINRALEESLSYQFVLETARSTGNLLAAKHIELIGAPENGFYSSLKAMLAQRFYLSLFGGFCHQKRKIFSFSGSLLADPAYSLTEKWRLMTGSSFSLKHLWDDFAHTNFTNDLLPFPCPVYFIMGIHDKLTFPHMAEDFMNLLEAPAKKMFLFRNSAHMAWYEEPEKFGKTLEELIITS